MLKTYQIELRRVSYDNLTVEADSVEHAKEQAKEYVDRTYYRDDGDWQIVSVDLEEPIK
jgi:hypothetical protein